MVRAKINRVRSRIRSVTGFGLNCWHRSKAASNEVEWCLVAKWMNRPVGELYKLRLSLWVLLPGSSEQAVVMETCIVSCPSTSTSLSFSQSLGRQQVGGEMWEKRHPFDGRWEVSSATSMPGLAAPADP